jgi:hypothetical protein
MHRTRSQVAWTIRTWAVRVAVGALVATASLWWSLAPLLLLLVVVVEVVVASVGPRWVFTDSSDWSVFLACRGRARCVFAEVVWVGYSPPSLVCPSSCGSVLSLQLVPRQLPAVAHSCRRKAANYVVV